MALRWPRESSGPLDSIGHLNAIHYWASPPRGLLIPFTKSHCRSVQSSQGSLTLLMSNKDAKVLTTKLTRDQPNVFFASFLVTGWFANPKTLNTWSFVVSIVSTHFLLSILYLLDSCEVLYKIIVSASSPFVGFDELNDNTIKGLTSLLSVKQEIKFIAYTCGLWNEKCI